jgi:hypothetical protein
MKPLNQNNMLEKLNIDVSQFWEIIWKFFVGALFSIFGFFEPVKDIVHLMVFFFFIDMILGYWAAHKTRGERFSARIIWKTTMPRMIISLVLVLGAFM